MKNLSNKTITIIEARSLVNSKPNNSKITNQEITLGKIIHEREDGLFFDNIVFNATIYRPFLIFDTNTIVLNPCGSKRNKPIYITKYEIVK